MTISPRNSPGFPQVLVCTVATHRCPGLDLLEASCERAGIGLTIFGLGDRYDSSRFKVRALRAGLEAVGADFEIVVMVDAFDTFFVRGLGPLLDEWRRYGAPVLFSAERNCHPPDGPRPDEYPEAPTEYRFLNSGGVVARIDSLMRLFEIYDVSERWALPDDQGFWARLFLERAGEAVGAGEIALDYYCRIFQCQWISEQDLRLGFDRAAPWSRPRPRIRNWATGATPSVFHANGFCDIRPFARHVLGTETTHRVLGPGEARSDMMPVAKELPRGPLAWCQQGWDRWQVWRRQGQGSPGP